MLALLLIAQLAATDVPCAVPVPEGTGAWKQVDATSVTFCVPAGWRVRGMRASYGGGSLRWQHSAPPPQTRQAAGPQSISGRSGGSGGASVRTQRQPEMIGGRQSEIWWQEGVGRLQTGVSFSQSPLFSITGEAAGDEQVKLQLAVYRTVRFVGSGG